MFPQEQGKLNVKYKLRKLNVFKLLTFRTRSYYSISYIKVRNKVNVRSYQLLVTPQANSWAPVPYSEVLWACTGHLQSPQYSTHSIG